MKKVIIAILLLASPIMAQEELKDKPPQIEIELVEPNPDHAINLIKIALNTAKANVESVDDIKSYQAWVSRTIKPGKVMRATDLDKKMQQVFLIYQSNRLHHLIIGLNDKWQRVLVSHEQEKTEFDKKIEATLQKALKELHDTHILLAQKREKLISNFLESQKSNKKLHKEVMDYLEAVKNEHKRLGLIAEQGDK